METTYLLRQATAADFPDIRGLIHAVNINPTGLDWPRFVVAVTPEGELIGCGQIKPHRDGSRELASIAVTPEWRKKGVASAMIEHLIASQAGALYLTCRSGLGPFYEKFGFRRLERSEMPPTLRRISRLAAALKVFIRDEMLVMGRYLE